MVQSAVNLDPFHRSSAPYQVKVNKVRLVRTALIALLFVFAGSAEQTNSPFEKPGIALSNQSSAVAELKSVDSVSQPATNSAPKSSVKVTGSVSVGFVAEGVLRPDVTVSLADYRAGWYLSVGSSGSTHRCSWR